MGVALAILSFVLPSFRRGSLKIRHFDLYLYVHIRARLGHESKEKDEIIKNKIKLENAYLVLEFCCCPLFFK